MGVTFLAHASTGYFSLYIDGKKLLSFVGNTRALGVTGVYIGGRRGTGGGWANVYFDDLYIDTGSGDPDAVVPSRFFPFHAVTADDTPVDWTASAGTDASCVDDAAAPNDDTDYVLAAAAGLDDFFQVQTTTVAAFSSISAVVPAAHARRTVLATDSEIELRIKQGANFLTGPAIDLIQTYDGYNGHFPLAPDGGAWDATKFNASRFGFRSSGTF